MEIKWYWPMELLGLVKDVSGEYNDGWTHYQVSRMCDTVMRYLILGLIPAMLLLGFFIRKLAGRAGQNVLGVWLVRGGVILLLIYALLLAAGVGPYIKLYPRGGSFLSFDTLDHILRGIYCALLALALFLGGRVGRHKT